jgi:TRAP transporter TAXI family solute receptor
MRCRLIPTFATTALMMGAALLASPAAEAQLFGATTTPEQKPQTAQSQRKLVPARPAAPRSLTQQQLTEKLNQNTVTVISGNPNGTYLFFAYDLSAVLDDGDSLRILPVIGKGGYQNVKDILHLKGVDLGITQSNIMSYLKKSGELGTNIDERLAYIAKLYNEEMHILAGNGINSIQDLNGKTVNFSDIGSGTQFSTRLIFEALGIKATEINVGQADGYLKVKSGEIAATVLIAGKPAGSFARFKLEPGMKILPVPYTAPLEADYFPAKLTAEDYPGLVKPGETIDTVAVGAVLAVYNWPRDTDRYRRVAKFTEAFMANFAAFQKAPRHVKWKEANLATVVRGWKRFPAAQEALDRVSAQAAVPAPRAVDPAIARAQAARAAPNNPAEQERLFQQFLEWSKQQKQ